MKMLKSFGCSFIYGSDLADSDPELEWSPSQHTWPALLAQHLNYQYGCYARGGRGNLFILNSILNQITNSNNDLFVIAWTWAERQDYLDHDLNWKVIRATDTTDLSKFYYKNLYSDTLHRLQNLIYIKTAVDLLTEKNIPFIMTHMDMNLFDDINNLPSQLRGLTQLVNQIRPHITTFDGLNFLDWSRKNGYPESELWHPLEQAHEFAEQYIFKTVFDKQKTSDPAQLVLS
jgi:hypothetical protein